MMKVASSGVCEVHRWLILLRQYGTGGRSGTRSVGYSRAKDDLVENHLPDGSPVLAGLETLLNPLFLLLTNQASGRVELLSKLSDVVDVVVQVGDVSVVLPSQASAHPFESRGRQM